MHALPRRPLGPVRAAALVVVLLAGCRSASRDEGRTPAASALADPLPVPPPTEIPPGETFVVAAAGDIAGRLYRQGETAALLLDLVRDRSLAAILPLGDLQYPRGEYHDFLADYDRSWGQPALKALTRPVPGNHEYEQGRSSAEGYFDYFNGRGRAHGIAGERGRGYYSYDMGDWHLVAINTSDGCRKIPCGPGSALHAWLVRDLARNERRCALAYFHHPRFHNGDYHGDATAVNPLWDVLWEAGVDVVLNGHDHNFQQLAPLDREGRLDRERGIRTFVVGTGGARHYLAFDEQRNVHAVEARVAGRHGVLELTLGPGRYEWRFLAVAGVPGGQALASGSDVCR